MDHRDEEQTQDTSQGGADTTQTGAKSADPDASHKQTHSATGIIGIILVIIIILIAGIYLFSTRNTSNANTGDQNTTQTDQTSPVTLSEESTANTEGGDTGTPRGNPATETPEDQPPSSENIQVR